MTAFLIFRTFTMSLQEEEFGSDTDDDDYIPDCDPVVGSEEENSGDEEGAQDDAPAEGGVACKKKRKKKTPEAMKRKKTTHGGRGFMFEEENAGEGPVDWKAEVEKEKAPHCFRPAMSSRDCGGLSLPRVMLCVVFLFENKQHNKIASSSPS